MNFGDVFNIDAATFNYFFHWFRHTRKSSRGKIYKKFYKENEDDYSPLSLLSNINEIFERIIFDRIKAYLEKTSYFWRKIVVFWEGKWTIQDI